MWRPAAQGQGFIFTDHSRYAHGTLHLQAMHAFSPETRVRLRYYYAPNLFLGDNEERRSGMQRLVDETVTSHIWSARVERELRPGLEVRGATTKISQGGIPTSGTVGPHVNWRIFPRVKLGLSYHYERGLAEGRHQPQFKDDVSYVNHYTSADLDIELMERLTLVTAFHYERNNWTSGITGDERKGAHEDVYQVEAILIKRLTDTVQKFVGVQRSTRKQSFESESVKNTNVGVGLAAVF